MSQAKRRSVLAIAGAGAAAGTVAITTGTAYAKAKQSPDSAQESVVAHVPDPHSDEVELMVGEREVVVHDRDLVVRILNAAGGK